MYLKSVCASLLFRATLKVRLDSCLSLLLEWTTLIAPNFKKFTSCLREGLIHEWKQALLAPPLPLMSLNNSRLCSTHNHSSAFLSTATLYQRYIAHDHLLGLAYDRKTWACPMSTVLATVAFLLLLDTSLLSQAGTTHYSQLLTLKHSTKLLFFFLFFFVKSI